MSELKYSADEPIEYPSLQFGRKLLKIIFDDLAPDKYINKLTFWQKVWLKIKLQKRHFNFWTK